MPSVSFKKLFCLAASMLMLSGCGAGDVTPQNYVAPGALSADQKELIELIAAGGERISIFDVKTADVYSAVSFWVETYRFGVLTASRVAPVEIKLDEAKALSGKLAAIVNRTPEVRWTLIYKEDDGAKTVGTSDPDPAFEATGSASCTLEKSIEISDGKEMVLLVDLYDDGGSFGTIDMQSLLDENRLSQYAYAQIVKCRFSR